MKVFLDDLCDTFGSGRETPDGWVGVKTANEAIALLENHEVESLDLDHDLGDEGVVGSGYDVLEWLEIAVAERGFIPPLEIIVHSANPAVYPKMLQAISSIRRQAERNTENGRKAEHG